MHYPTKSSLWITASSLWANNDPACVGSFVI